MVIESARESSISNLDADIEALNQELGPLDMNNSEGPAMEAEVYADDGA